MKFSYIRYTILFVAVMLAKTAKASEQEIELSLEESIRLAIKENPFIDQLEELYFASDSESKVALSLYLPRIEGLYQMYFDNPKSPLTYAHSNFLTNLQCTQNILSLDAYYTHAASVEKRKIAFDLFIQGITEVARSIKTAYVAVQAEYEKKKLAEEIIEIYARLTFQKEDQYKIGTKRLIEVNEAQVALSEATTYLFEVQQALQQAQYQLIMLLGYDPTSHLFTTESTHLSFAKDPFITQKLSLGSDLLSTDFIEGFVLNPNFLVKLSDAAKKLFPKEEISQFRQQILCHNPILQQKEDEIGYANQSVKLAMGRYAPEIFARINLGGTPDPFDEFPSSTFSSQVFKVGAGIEVHWLLFDSFGRENEIRKMKQKKHATESSKEQSENDLFRQLGDELAKFQQSFSTYITSKAAANLAKQAMWQAKEALDIGYITIFDYERAVDNYKTAQIHVIEASLALFQSRYGLSYLLGDDRELYTLRDAWNKPNQKSKKVLGKTG